MYIYIYVYIYVSFIPLQSCDFLRKIPIKINIANDKDNSQNKPDTEQTKLALIGLKAQ